LLLTDDDDGYDDQKEAGQKGIAEMNVKRIGIKYGQSGRPDRLANINQIRDPRVGQPVR